ncbi:MAG TPA: hypothetical protein VF657_23230 [Actinoplanes sp.]|jgi:ABC-type sugar transport system substrate-binding protein
MNIHLKSRRALSVSLAAVLVGGLGLLMPPATAAPIEARPTAGQSQFNPRGNYTAVWNRADAAGAVPGGTDHLRVPRPLRVP